MKSPRIVLVPTLASAVWVLAVVALLVMAINYGNNLVFALAFLLLSIWVSAAWECRRNLSGLEWQPAPEPSAFAGEALCLTGRVRDPMGRRRDPLMLCAGQGRRRVQGIAVGLAGKADDSTMLELAWPATARGRQRIGNLYLVSLHPLGLWRAHRHLQDATALVYPHPAGSRPLPEKAQNPAHQRRESGDFQGLRAYAPGDAPRRVNWRIYARSEELAVNDFDGGMGGYILWLDINACEGDTDACFSQLCKWVCDAERQGLEYGLRLGGLECAPGRGRAHRLACLERLALHGENRNGVDL